MKFLDAWSIFTGLASLISLLLAFGDKFSDWRKYTLPLSCAFGGFAVGRISFVSVSGVEQIFNDGLMGGFMIIFFSIVIIAALLAYFLIKHNETYLGYIGVIIILMLVMPQILKVYSDTYNVISTNDYLILANEKEKTGEYESAINYLEKCSARTQNNILKEQITKKIPELQQKLASKVINSPESQNSR